MIHLHRHGRYAALRPLGARRWALQTGAGDVRAILEGRPAEARREAKRIIDHHPQCFPDQSHQQGGQEQ